MNAPEMIRMSYKRLPNSGFSLFFTVSDSLGSIYLNYERYRGSLLILPSMLLTPCSLIISPRLQIWYTAILPYCHTTILHPVFCVYGHFYGFYHRGRFHRKRCWRVTKENPERHQIIRKFPFRFINPMGKRFQMIPVPGMCSFDTLFEIISFRTCPIDPSGE